MSQDISPSLVLSSILHELRQPLTAAVINVDLAARRIVRLRRALYHAADGLDAIACLEAQLSGNPGRVPRPRRQAISRALVSLIHKEETIRVDVPDGLTVVAVPGTLRQVLHNLLANARKYAPRATVTIRVRPLGATEHPWPPESSVTITGPMVLLTVADTGPGIPQALRPNLFMPCVPQGHGFGLGLWFCRLFVRAQGGDLWLDPTPIGASFSSVWPMGRCQGWPKDPVEFGRAVRQAREEAGLTRDEFATQTGIDPTTLRNVEVSRHRCTGKTRRALIQAFADLADMLPSNPPKRR